MGNVIFRNSGSNNSSAYTPDATDQTSKILDYPEFLGSADDHDARRHAHGYWIGSDIVKIHETLSDPHFGRELLNFFKKENCASVIDAGAGDGMYSAAISAHAIFVNCYDGNPQTQRISNGRCAVLDFSQRLNLPFKYDWVLSLNVGKHTPKQFEETFIKNLDQLNNKGIIISWGGPSEMAAHSPRGVEYFNQQPDSYIIDKFTKLGYRQDITAQKMLRTAATDETLHDRLLVLRRENTYPSGS